MYIVQRKYKNNHWIDFNHWNKLKSARADIKELEDSDKAKNYKHRIIQVIIKEIRKIIK